MRSVAEATRNITDDLRIRALVHPRPPVGRTHVNQLLRCRIDPTMLGAPARKCERMFAIFINDSQLQIAVERRGQNRLPDHQFLFAT
jgi:hypothetical protein